MPLTTLPGVQRYPSFSPDGNHVAFTWTGPKQDNPDIYVQQIGAGSPLRLTTDPGNDYNPVWSPDGRWIAFLRSQSEAGKSELRLIPPLGGPERKLAEIRVRGGICVTPPYLAWCPDSNCLVVTDSPGEGKPDALFVVSLETGEKRQLTNPPPLWPATPTRRSLPTAVGWSSAGAPALFTGELYRLPLGKGVTAVGEPQRLTPAALDAGYPAWMPDSKEILFSARRRALWRLVVSGEQAQPARLPFVGEDGHDAGGFAASARAAGSSGLRSQFPGLQYLARRDLWLPARRPPRRLSVSISSTRHDWHAPAFSRRPPGGLSSDRSGEWEIWLADLDGSNAVQLTSMGAVSTGYPALVSRRRTDCVPLQSRRAVGDLS